MTVNEEGILSKGDTFALQEFLKVHLVHGQGKLTRHQSPWWTSAVVPVRRTLAVPLRDTAQHFPDEFDLKKLGANNYLESKGLMTDSTADPASFLTPNNPATHCKVQGERGAGPEPAASDRHHNRSSILTLDTSNGIRRTFCLIRAPWFRS